MTLDAWNELDELAAVLAEFDVASTGEYFGVSLMRGSLLQRRADLVEEILSHQEQVAETLDLVFDGSSSTARGVPVPVLTGLLAEIQEALAAIGTAIARGPRRVRVSAQMRQLVSLRVALALPGSLAVRLVPADDSLTRTSVDLLGEHTSVLEQSAERLVTFFRDVAGDESTALGAISELGPRGAARLHRVARLLVQSESEARIRWHSPRADHEAFVDMATARRVEELLAALEESEVTLTYVGRLAGGSLLRRRFELLLPDGQVLTGSVEDSVTPLLTEFFGSRCQATIIVSEMSTPGGLTKQSRTLVGLTAIPAPG